jgi:uncharacterized protein (TIGR00106 family)
LFITKKEIAMAMMEIAILPVGTQTTSVSPYVADLIAFLKKKHVTFELNGMGTTITGKPESLFRLASQLHSLPFRRGVQRVYTVLKIDDRRDKVQTPKDKVDSVLRKIKENTKRTKS